MVIAKTILNIAVVLAVGYAGLRLVNTSLVHLEHFIARSAVVIRIRIKTKPLDQWNVGREYRRRLKKAFDDEGVEIPFPHRSLYAGSAGMPLKIQFVPVS